MKHVLRFLPILLSAAWLIVAASPNLAGAVSLTLRNRVVPVPPGGILVYTVRVNNDGGSGDSPAEGCFNPPPECINISANRWICVRAFNEGANCGTGTPAKPEPSFCIANPAGVCASGPNFGLPCTSPHGLPTEECPSDEENPEEPAPGDPNQIVVTLPIPPETTFISADRGGTSDGGTITWTMPPLDPCGVPGTPQCPLLTTELLVDPQTPLGTIIENRATVTVGSTSSITPPQQTVVGTFRLRRFSLFYPKGLGRDRVLYRGFFTIRPGEGLHPADEPFHLLLDAGDTRIFDLSLAAGELQQTSETKFIKFKSRLPGISRALLREVAPYHYLFSLRAHRLDLPVPQDLDATLTLVFGDVVLPQPISLVIRRDGRRFLGFEREPTTTTTTTSTTFTTTTVTMPSSTSTTSTSLATTTTTASLPTTTSTSSPVSTTTLP